MTTKESAEKILNDIIRPQYRPDFTVIDLGPDNLDLVYDPSRGYDCNRVLKMGLKDGVTREAIVVMAYVMSRISHPSVDVFA